MSLLSGGFISGNKLVLEDYLISLPKYISSRVENNQQVTLGMRQEAVHISAEAASANEAQLPAEVESFESDFVHRTQTVHLRTGHWNYSGLASLDMQFRMGQRVHAQLDPEQLYFFDMNSGLRL